MEKVTLPHIEVAGMLTSKIPAKHRAPQSEGSFSFNILVSIMG